MRWDLHDGLLVGRKAICIDPMGALARKIVDAFFAPAVSARSPKFSVVLCGRLLPTDGMVTLKMLLQPLPNKWPTNCDEFAEPINTHKHSSV